MASILEDHYMLLLPSCLLEAEGHEALVIKAILIVSYSLSLFSLAVLDFGIFGSVARKWGRLKVSQ